MYVLGCVFERPRAAHHSMTAVVKDNQTNATTTEKQLHFRNYVPRSDEFKPLVLPPAVPIGTSELLKKFNEIQPEAEDDEVAETLWWQ
jgi:hypothetical protein